MSKISFDNTEVAFADKTTAELRRALWLFRFIGNTSLVKFSAPFVSTVVRTGLPIKRIVRNTVFRHFCGGENIQECDSAIGKLWSSRIGTILDYSVEGQQKENDFEFTCREILSTIDKAADNEQIPFSVFKTTGIARMELLEKVSAGKNMSATEHDEFNRVKQRVEKICIHAHEKNVPVFFDAEESWVQKCIDKMAEEMMLKYTTVELKLPQLQ